MARRRFSRSEWISPDLTPLIDVVFILLIFFLVTSIFREDKSGLKIELPSFEKSSKESVLQKREDVLLEVNKQALSWNGDLISFKELPDLVSKTEKKQKIKLEIDKKVSYERFLRVLHILQVQKHENIELNYFIDSLQE